MSSLPSRAIHREVNQQTEEVAKRIFLCAAGLWLLSITGCPQEVFSCASMARRCGGENQAAWEQWCMSSCVPEHARTVPCMENDICLLCDAPRDDGMTSYFGVPNEVEYLWTQLDLQEEPTHPSVEPAPTGGAFDDQDWAQRDEDHFGAWQSHQPYDVVLGQPSGFCEPGPNQFVHRNVAGSSDAITLRGERMPEEFFDEMYCDYPNCPWGPYDECGAARVGACQYGDAPEMSGVGSGSQVDRVDASGEMPTYGYGRTRAILRAGDDTTGPQPGFVYAFFSQSNAYCSAANEPNLETNTAEIDVELSSGPGRAEAEIFCDPSQMCFQVSTWVSSTQGIGPSTRGIQRHQVSGFRFRDAATAGQYRTYGWDWRPDRVRFTYDADPRDCDEATGACPPTRASIAICEHLRFVPRRPQPMHLQVWNARWAGRAPPGTRAAMSINRLWHTPFAEEP